MLYKSLKLTVYPALELSSLPFELIFTEKQGLLTALDSMAKLLLFLQDEAKAMPDYSNVFEISLLRVEDDQWEVVEEVQLREDRCESV